MVVCDGLSAHYLIDLYRLYGKTCGLPDAGGKISSVLTIRGQDSNPKEWLGCVKWSRFRRAPPAVATMCAATAAAANGNDLMSLEVLVERPGETSLYYAVGESGTLLVSSSNPSDTMEIHEETVKILAGESCEYCTCPMILLVKQHAEKKH